MLVTLPEETPVNELIETAYAVEDRAGVALGPDRGELLRAAARPRRRRRSVTKTACVPMRSQPGSRSTTARCGRSPTRPRSATISLDGKPTSARGSPSGSPLPQLRLPFFFTADVGPAEIEILADELTAGITSLDDVAAR